MERDDTCLTLLKHLENMLEKKLNHVMTELDITTTQAATLVKILSFPNKQVHLKQLEKTLHLSQSVTAGIVVRLEQKKLLESFGDPADKRIKIVKVTPKGEELCRDAQERMRVAEEEGLSGLTEEEKAVFVSLLKKAIAAMQ